MRIPFCHQDRHNSISIIFITPKQDEPYLIPFQQITASHGAHLDACKSCKVNTDVNVYHLLRGSIDHQGHTHEAKPFLDPKRLCILSVVWIFFTHNMLSQRIRKVPLVCSNTTIFTSNTILLITSWNFQIINLKKKSHKISLKIEKKKFGIFL